MVLNSCCRHNILKYSISCLMNTYMFECVDTWHQLISLVSLHVQPLFPFFTSVKSPSTNNNIIPNVRLALRKCVQADCNTPYWHVTYWHCAWFRLSQWCSWGLSLSKSQYNVPSQLLLDILIQHSGLWTLQPLLTKPPPCIQMSGTKHPVTFFYTPEEQTPLLALLSWTPFNTGTSNIYLFRVTKQYQLQNSHIQALLLLYFLDQTSLLISLIQLFLWLEDTWPCITHLSHHMGHKCCKQTAPLRDVLE